MGSIYNLNLAQSGHKSVADPEFEKNRGAGGLGACTQYVLVKNKSIYVTFKGKLLNLS